VSTTRPSYYDVLGVEPAATASEIRASWKHLVRENHPDHAELAEQQTATERTAAINEAYQTLIDPPRRARYDRKHLVGGGRRTSFAPSMNQDEALDSLVRLRHQRRIEILRTGGATALGLAAIAYTLRWLKLF
jgi:curved DNA-binding protein CbpA